MSYTYGFFDAVDLGGGNFDRVYSSAEFSHYWALLVGDGVFGQPSTSLNVLAMEPVAMRVKVAPGTGWIKGHYLTVPDNMDEVILVPVANPSLPRIDSIIMALNNADRDMKLYLRSGTAAASPKPVTLQRDADVWELELAQITVAAGAGNIPQTAIKDMRPDPNRCGIVTGLIDQFDVSGFFTAAQASFNEWFADIQNQLGEDVAGNLLNLINQTNQNLSNLSSHVDDSIQGVNGQISTLAYDLYTLWMKSYYMGEGNWSPPVIGAKGMAFDGFVDNSLVDTSSTTATVDTTERKVDFHLPISTKQRPSATFSPGDPGVLENSINHSATTWSASWKGSGKGNPTGKTMAFKITFSEKQIVKGLYLSAVGGGFSQVTLLKTKASLEGDSNYVEPITGTYALAYSDNSSPSSQKTWSKDFNFANPTPIKILQLLFGARNTGGSGEFDGNSVAVYVNLYQDVSKAFSSKSISLLTGGIKAKMFISLINKDKLDLKLVFPQGEVVGEVKSSRTDPMFPQYTEYEVDFDIPSGYSGGKVYLSSIVPIVGTPIPSIKRYGIYVY